MIRVGGQLNYMFQKYIQTNISLKTGAFTVCLCETIPYMDYQGGELALGLTLQSDLYLKYLSVLSRKV